MSAEYVPIAGTSYSLKTYRVRFVAEGERDPRRGNLLNEPELAKTLARSIMAGAEPGQERTVAILLNARNRVIGFRECYVGTIDHAVVEPREILKAALLNDAPSVILVHNHPSGDPTPSREDREFTRRLLTAAEACGIRLLDHIVVGDAQGAGALDERQGAAISFREAGLL